MEQLLLKLQQNNLVDEMGNIILERYEHGVQAVDQETFRNFFGITDFTYATLKEADQGKGYTRFFDKWKEIGIL
jgi:hypothetical protein